MKKSYYPHKPKERDPAMQHKTSKPQHGQASGKSAKSGAVKSAGSRPNPSLGSRGPGPRVKGPRPSSDKVSDLSQLTRLGRWVIGVHAAEEVLKQRPQAVRKFFVRDDWESSETLTPIVELARRKGVGFEEKSQGQIEGLLKAAQTGSGHQGVLMVVGERPQIDWKQIEKSEKCVLVALDGLEDPQNLGSILRTSWLMNVSGILVPQDRSAQLSPTVAKVASGGAEHVPVESVSNLGAELRRLKDMGFWIFGLAEQGTHLPWQLNMADKICWVVGNEGSGLRQSTEKFCDELVRIPQVKSGSSYNASVSLAMVLSETCRQIGQVGDN